MTDKCWESTEKRSPVVQAGGRAFLAGLVGAALLSGFGCGSEKRKVAGVVTLDGKPVAAAMVEFLPQGGHGQPAHGVSDDSGRFQLGTLDKADGAWPGEYKIVVRKYEIDPSMLEKTDGSDPNASQRNYEKGWKALTRPKKWLIPALYREEATTPLRWKIPDDNNKTLELKSSGGS